MNNISWTWQTINHNRCTNQLEPTATRNWLITPLALPSGQFDLQGPTAQRSQRLKNVPGHKGVRKYVLMCLEKPEAIKHCHNGTMGKSGQQDIIIGCLAVRPRTGSGERVNLAVWCPSQGRTVLLVQFFFCFFSCFFLIIFIFLLRLSIAFFLSNSFNLYPIFVQD